MITLEIPTDPALLAAVGKIALRHGQLDYVLRMTVKSIQSLSIREALDATERQGSHDLRKRVRKLAKQKFGESETLVRLDALINKSRRATDRRNELLHNLWSYDMDRNPVIRDDDHTFRPAPNIAELNTVADEFAAVALELNVARLNGFLKEALSQ